MQENQKIVEQFARALDQEDYPTAESTLDDDCQYLCRGERYIGPTEIIASYKGNGDAAKKFDAIEYESFVSIAENGQYRVQFSDHIEHQGRRFTFRCEQRVEINDSGLISRIEHVDLPGQRDALSEFQKSLSADPAGGPA